MAQVGTAGLAGIRPITSDGLVRPLLAIDRPEIEVFVVPGGNFPTMSSVASWEREFGKPVVTTNQASFWAMLRALKSSDRLPGFGRLLAEVPAEAA